MDAGNDRAPASDWCETLTGMYRQSAAKRRMQIKEIGSNQGRAHPAHHRSVRTLQAEAGLHVLDDPTQDNARRTVARDGVGGPDRNRRKAANSPRRCKLLAALTNPPVIIRRYREGPRRWCAMSPAAGAAAGWTSGGDFDLMGAVARRQADEAGDARRRLMADWPWPNTATAPSPKLCKERTIGRTEPSSFLVEGRNILTTRVIVSNRLKGRTTTEAIAQWLISNTRPAEFQRRSDRSIGVAVVGGGHSLLASVCIAARCIRNFIGRHVPGGAPMRGRRKS